MKQRLMQRFLLAFVALPLLWACAKIEDQPTGPIPTIDDVVGLYEGTMSISPNWETTVKAEVTKEAITFERFPAEYLAMSVFPESEHKAIASSLKIKPLVLRYTAWLLRNNIVMGLDPMEFTFDVTVGEQLHTFTARVTTSGEAAYGGNTQLFTCYLEVNELLMDGEPARSFNRMTFVLKPTAKQTPK